MPSGTKQNLIGLAIGVGVAVIAGFVWHFDWFWYPVIAYGVAAFLTMMYEQGKPKA